MQISRAVVIPVELRVCQPIQMAGLPEFQEVTAIFVRLETTGGQQAWGCTVAHPHLTGQKPEEVIRGCQACADLAPDLHPTNLEYSLGEIHRRVKPSAAVQCAFDLAFYDLLGLAAGMPLYRLLGGFRNQIQTSVTIPVSPVSESVETARKKASAGFRILKIKGGVDPAEDVQRVTAIRRHLPSLSLRLDADGGYSPQEALDVARALEGKIEMLEQPVRAGDLAGLRQVKMLSPVPILADQSAIDPGSALELSRSHSVDGVSIKLAACGGIQPARQMDAIARAAHFTVMVSCYVEPALLISAGLSLALSSPAVQYGDLDGHLDLVNDPSRGGFQLENGWLTASDVPGLGYSVDL